MKRPRVRLQDYTVGWVCALPIEHAAATGLLDEEHEDLVESNLYSLGRISNHNVVISCLPAGQTGTCSATAVALQMKSTFPSVKIGLMVGIGGGVPSGSDIRLGDVVVSQPHLQHGGVVQYDFGKSGAGGQFTRTGFLNAPPMELLNAVSKLRSNHFKNRTSFSGHLSTFVAHFPEFAPPMAGSDMLFEPDYDHITGPTCDGCSRDRVIERITPRGKEIMVHYGTIASGNKVIKDGRTRDRLSSELGGVLCFEMEAAGLMNIFPCLVIRGICDYADSHKNKEWQPYAAATAAAFAKELLSIIPVVEVPGVRIGNSEGIASVEAYQLKPEEQEAQKICLNKLFLTNPYDDRAKLISAKLHRVEGTCEWIRDDVLFRSWLDPGSRLLWITGGPGKGKTMLSIFLTEEVLVEVMKRSKDAKLIFYFCDHQDEKRNTAIAILRGLLHQILKELPKLTKSVYPEFETEKKSTYTITSLEALWRIFESLLRDLDFGTIYCVIDGLDECDAGSLQLLLKKLSSFFQACGSSPTVGEFKLIVVSRELPGPFTTKLSTFPRLKLDPDLDDKIESDIQKFISVKVDELSMIHGFSSTFRAYMEKTLLERAEGTFLWVGFVTNEILQGETCTDIVETLESLPKGLSGIYSRMLLQIKDGRRNNAISILRWVVMALRPLSLLELATAINLTPINNMSSSQAILDCVKSCGAFIKMTNGCIGLVHQSARDYLMRERPDHDPTLESFRIEPEEANLDLARTCFKYIQKEAVTQALTNPNHSSHTQKFPLLNYAAFCWPKHMRKSGSAAESLLDLSIPFFQTESPVLNNWWKGYHGGINIRSGGPSTSHLLHVASFLGITSWAKKLLDNKSEVNAKDVGGMTALHLAARHGQSGVVQLLLDNKSEVNAKDVGGMTALHWAALSGHSGVVQLLLNNKSDVDAKDVGGMTALHWAARHGQSGVVQLLLDKKSEVNAKDVGGMTALHLAALSGHNGVVQLLLNNKSDVDAKNVGGMTALHLAALSGHNGVVQLLLNNKSEVNAKDVGGVTALHLAALSGHNGVVQLLLNNKSEVNTKFVGGMTALHLAARHGHSRVIQMLLDKKSEVNAKDVGGMTALHLAARHGHSGVIQMLLDNKSEVNAKDVGGMTALHLAALARQSALVPLLLNNKADFSMKNRAGSTALDTARQRGHTEIEKLLLAAARHQ